VATRVGGIPELVKDGETGFVVERGDAEAIAESILTLAADRELRKQMGSAGLVVANARFDLKRNVGRVVRSYRIAPPEPVEPACEPLASAV
jgi:glycosyltransferase involved in cell wall biosynthesis